MKMRKPAEDLTRQFHEVFGLNLYAFWNPIFGFDVVKFDSNVGTPDGVSCRDHIAARYGEQSVALIKALMET